MFRYHHEVDLFTLRNAGIRTFREVEEVIEGYSVSDRLLGPGRYYEYIGFTRESRPLEVTIKETEEADLIIKQVSRPSVEKIINSFCRYCHSTKHPNT